MTTRPGVHIFRPDDLYDAAGEAIAALKRMAARGENPVTAVFAGADAAEEWTHYPEGDARDRRGRARYYYHVHSADECGAGEHGHFHVFLERPGEADAAPTHVVGLAMDAHGRLLRLFASNRWVTGETWRDAASIRAELPSFDIAGAAPCAELDRWISAIVRFYAPRISALLAQRDAAIDAMRVSNPGGDVLEDRSVRLLAEAPVDFLQDLAAVEDLLDRAAG